MFFYRICFNELTVFIFITCFMYILCMLACIWVLFPKQTYSNSLQADGACWMAFYCISMLDLSLELARHDAVYEDIAIQMLNNFLVLCGCINGTETADSGRSGRSTQSLT